jgi:hypothetical protein
VCSRAPILEKPLRQKGRRPVAIEGDALDTAAACPPPTIAEMSKLMDLNEKQAHRLAGEAAKARSAFIARQSKRLAEQRPDRPNPSRVVINGRG